MTDRHLLATFDYEDDLLAATEEVRLQGYQIVDVYTPYAVHGLESAMGLRPSRLTWVCFLCGLTGALLALWFQHWTAATSWPLDVGGKPWNSLPADVPVTFEMMVLLAGFGSVFALLGVSRLYPGKQAHNPSVRVTNDQFVLVLDEAGSEFDLASARKLLEKHHVQNIEEQLASKPDAAFP
jgi:hypothetical protein